MHTRRSHSGDVCSCIAVAAYIASVSPNMICCASSVMKSGTCSGPFLPWKQHALDQSPQYAVGKKLLRDDFAQLQTTARYDCISKDSVQVLTSNDAVV